VSLPSLEAPLPAGLPADLPWEDPDQAPVPALLRTVGAFLRRPGRSFRAMQAEGVGPALSFGVITGTFGMEGALYNQLLAAAAMGLPLLRWSDPATAHLLLLLFILLTPVLVLVGLVVGSLALAVVLWPWRRPGLGAAFRVTGYAQAGMVAALLPLVGSFLGLSLSLYLRVRGVQEIFGLSVGRASLAVLGALILEALLLVVGLMVLAAPLTLYFLL